MEQYHNLLKKILTSDKTGYKPNRTGVDTLSCFGAEEEFKLSDGFPMITTKKIHVKSIMHELIWFLRGSTNIKYLNENGVSIWDEWADKDGELGPVYGYQWRRWPDYEGGYIDQVQNVVNTIKSNPSNRRIIVSAWNVAEIQHMALPPCHLLYQFNVQDRKGETQLDLKMYQRSCDTFLGVPFNIASYAALTELVANETGLKPGYLMLTFGDLHLYSGTGPRGAFYGKHLETIKGMVREATKREDYLLIKSDLEKMFEKEGVAEQDLSDHVPQSLLQLSREPRHLPKLIINSDAGVNNVKYEDFHVVGYDNPHPHIKGEIAK